MAVHGRDGACGYRRSGDGGTFAILVMVSIVVLPEGLFAEIFVGLIEHVVVDTDPSAVHVKFTSAGKVEFAGSVVKTSATFPGVPAVSCTAPGADCSRSKSTLVKENVASVAVPGAAAVTLYGPPAFLFAVKTADVATPLAFVVAVSTPPANVPLGPVSAGAVNVTVTPASAIPLLSFTVAFKVVPNAVPMIAR